MGKDSVAYLGESGNLYVFSLLEYPTELPSIAAVYVLTKRVVVRDGWEKIVSDTWPAIYFGESGDLKERFEDHSHEDCFAKHGATHIGIWTEKVNTRQYRQHAEGDLVRRHRPPCNQ